MDIYISGNEWIRFIIHTHTYILKYIKYESAEGFLFLREESEWMA